MAARVRQSPGLALCQMGAHGTSPTARGLFEFGCGRVAHPWGHFAEMGTIRTRCAFCLGGCVQRVHGGDFILLPYPSQRCPHQAPDHVLAIPEVRRSEDHQGPPGLWRDGPDGAAPPSVKAGALVKPMSFHSPPGVLACPTRCHRSIGNVRRLGSRLGGVQSAAPLNAELTLHGLQPSSHHLLIRRPRTTCGQHRHVECILGRVRPLIDWPRVQALLAPVRRQASHRERPDRLDKTPKARDFIIIHGLQLPYFRVRGVRVHHRRQLVQGGVRELLLVLVLGDVLVLGYLPAPQ